MMLVVYDSMTGNVKRFIDNTNVKSIRIHKDLIIDVPYILVTYCTGFGQIPKTTVEFLESNNEYLKGVAVSGNKNWGSYFGKSGETVSSLYNVPLLMKFELSGTKSEREKFESEVIAFDNKYS